jgi:hypothetical protein
VRRSKAAAGESKPSHVSLNSRHAEAQIVAREVQIAPARTQFVSGPAANRATRERNAFQARAQIVAPEVQTAPAEAQIASGVSANRVIRKRNARQAKAQIVDEKAPFIGPRAQSVPGGAPRVAPAAGTRCARTW